MSCVYAQNKELVKPLFMVRDMLDPRMMQTVMITTAEYAKAHPDIIKGLIDARREGLAYALDHPDEAADITAKAYNNPNVELFRAHVRELDQGELLERRPARLRRHEPHGRGPCRSPGR